MPTPRPNEPRAEFMERCIPEVIEEGYGQDQAVAMCSNYFRGEKYKKAAWKEFDSRRWGYLRYAISRVTKALRQQAEPYFQIDNLNEDVQLSEEPIRAAFKDIYVRVAQNFAKITFDNLKDGNPDVITKAFEVPENWDKIVAEWMAVNTTGLITGVTATTQQGIERLVEKAIVEGWGVEVFQKELRKNYLLSARRGRVIGRTEIIRASNFGSQQGAKQTGIPMRKTWISSRDNRVRPDHAFADGQQVENLDDSFLVGGERLKYPADPAGSPGNTIQCRCVEVYKPYRP